MNLLSHGEGSSLLEHLSEVMRAAETPEERIICAVHDIGKATNKWQEYIRNPTRDGSPHSHAATGGILAALIIWHEHKNNQQPSSKLTTAEWVLIALHTASAHHTLLYSLSNYLNDCDLIYSDKQAHAFLLDKEEGVASLLPEIPVSTLDAAWEDLPYPSNNTVKKMLNELYATDLDAHQRLGVFLKSRNLLGRLCFQDHQSAAKQSAKQEELGNWKELTGKHDFRKRVGRDPKSAEKNRLNELRTKVRETFLECMNQDSCFYSIDAPTGLGKTESMFSAAEKLLEKHQLERIIFAVPQVSIADQIYDEYFKEKEDVQIWNYRKRETKSDNSSEESNTALSFAYELVQNPFRCSYNITTFNQVLLAMCHPNRNRCIRGLNLKNAVIILDEFHKLPFVILPFFLRIARKFTEQNNCRFIFGSATALENSPYFDLGDAIQFPRKIAEDIYRANEIDNRRYYRNIGNLEITEVAERIEEIHAASSENLLVVLNLIGKGTWSLLMKFREERYNPWEQLDELGSDSKERIVIFLDGLVPPILRRALIRQCKEAMKKRPLTLISTQMIEVGVDLDFDRALLDYQGIAATIQRGGRVGREGKGEAKPVEVFQLIPPSELETSTSSFEALIKIAEEKDSRFTSKGAFKNPVEIQKSFWAKEKGFFKIWAESEETKKDSDLNSELLKIYAEILPKDDKSDDLVRSLFLIFSDTNIGMTIENAQFIAELFDTSDASDDFLVFRSLGEAEEFMSLQKEFCDNKSAHHKMEKSKLQKLFQFILDYKISVYDPKVKERLLCCNPQRIEEPESLTVIVLEGNIL